MRGNHTLTSIAVISVLLVAPLVLATPTGPSYPPEGGVTWSGAGNIGRAGGATWSYADLQMHLFNGIWWGPWNAEAFQFAFDGAIDEPTETLVFDFGSDLAGGMARWTGSTDLRHSVNGAYVTQNLPTRLTLRASVDGAPVAWIDPTTVGLDGDLGAVLPVAGSYQLNLLLEAQRNNVWTPVWTLYDSLSTDPACTSCVRTSIGGGFYTDLNQAPTAGFSWAPEAPVEGDEVTFTSTSSDPEGRPMTLAWDLDNDGAFDDADGASVSVTFADPGTYAIGLLATDDRGLTSTSVQEVTVVDCSVGPVSDALRNTVYPAVKDVAGNTAHFLACDVAAANGL